MARVNHNVNYLFDVDGETIWEKLRVIRAMLLDRKLAVGLIDLKEDIRKGKEIDTTSFRYRKEQLYKEHNDGLKQDVVNEIKFLSEFEEYLTTEAEKTRIDGKTDDEMYEINFFEEMRVRLVRRAQAQVISNGRINEELLLRLMKNQNAMDTCIQQGLLTQDVLAFTKTPLLPSADVHTNNYITYKEENQND